MLVKILVLLLIFVFSYIGYALFFYRDINVSDLQKKYPYQNLKTAQIEGVEIAYQVDGDEKLPVLLLLHSHYFSMRMWDDWIAPLTEHFRVVRFDMTSHGLTGADPKNDYSMQRSQQLLLGLLNYLDVGSLSIAGSSLGGNMAFTFAADHPQKVDNLVLINSGGLKRKNSRSGSISWWVDPIFYLLPRAAYRSLLKWMIADDSLVTRELVAEFHDMFRRRGNRSAELNRLRGFKLGDADETLTKITAPSLVMWGQENPQLEVSSAEMFKQKLVNSLKVEVKIYPNVGHVLPLEIPQQASQDVIDFLLLNQ